MVGCLDFLRVLCCGLRADCCEVRLRGKTERDCEKGCELSDRVSSVVIHSFDSGLVISLRGRCSFRRYGAPAPNRIRNGVRTRPHAPFEDRRVRSVSATRPGGDECLEVVDQIGRDVPGEDISEQSLIDEEACEFEASEGDYSGRTYERVLEFESWETLVVSLSNSAPNGKLNTSMVMDALFNEEARRREMGPIDQSELQALVSEGSREKSLGQGKGHHRDTAATVVMAVDESEVLLAASDNGKTDWVLDSSSAYHLCRDKEVFSTYAACEGRIWMANNTSSRVVGRGSVQFRMADGRSVTLTEWRNSQSFQGKQGDAVGKEDWRAIPIGGECPNRRSYGLTWVQWIQSGTRVQGDALGYVRKSGQTRVVQPVQDVHREAQRKETKSILRSCTAKGAAMPKRVSFALDLISGGVFSNWHLGEKVQTLRCGGAYTSSYGEAGSEAVMKDNLKTSDYPPVGWRGRLLSPAHLDESKPTWMSPSPVAKPKPDWSSPCDGETLELSRTL
ncbi:hypothetical protein Acr_04g0002070 [Actinidia rufa]|uniref:Retrovirus-related Pol polyprotein from transposon TNT 1-94-like beta-barrel domain-containing protein n=1 Tax=Actinidia rufa TaxID=165716 RepID=A0A7J0EHU1_9ERIC|nr:hypothetical protein Acr_04g0002070 [Actinidia rufa]